MVDPDPYWSEAQCELIRTVVVKKHDATDGDQLTLKVGDIVIVMEKDETGWWGGHKEGEETTGWFPGICVEQLEGFDPRESRRLSPGSASQDEGRHKNDEYIHGRTAVETGTSSPVRGSYVASPQRTSSASAQGSRDGYVDQQSRITAYAASQQLLEHQSRLVEDRQALILQVEQLKQENRSLEEKLRRQSDCDRRRYSQLEENFVSLEAKNREQMAELKVTRDHKNELSEANSDLQKRLQASASEKEKLQAEVRSRTEEVQTLSTKLEVELGQKTELTEEKKRLLRRVHDLETPERQPPTERQPPLERQPPAERQPPLERQPSQETTSLEQPPAPGVVKQLRDAYERMERSSTPTPRRPATSDQGRPKEQVSWGKAPGAPATMNLPTQAGTSRCGGVPRRNMEDDSEFSPFRRGKKDMRLAFPTEVCPKTSSATGKAKAAVGSVFGPHH